jgi:catechol 2,3-dioxygenase
MVSIGRVTLVVHDIDAVAAFYENEIGLHVVHKSGTKADLGTGDGTVLLSLHGNPAALLPEPRAAGLFHTAFLLPSRGDLGRWVRHALERGLVIVGAADHAVSEAVYLADPEGNGIEIYADRPRDLWRWNHGEVEMPSDRLDMQVLAKAGAERLWRGLPDGSVIGHVHLKVGGIAPAEAFYRDILGLAVTCHYPGGSFLAADGYHHHIAVNIWKSRGAKRIEGAVTGLAGFELLVDPDRLSSIRMHAMAAGISSPVDEGDRITLADPWGIEINVVSRPRMPAGTLNKHGQPVVQR